MKRLLLVFAIVLLNRCGNPQQVNARDMIHWVDNPENGLVQKQNVKSFQFEAKYRPAVYEAAIMLNKGKTMTMEIPEEDFYYFILKVGTEKDDLINWNAPDEAAVKKNIYYLSFSMQNDIHLIDGGDTLDCVHYVFERSFGMGNQRVFNLGFAPSEWNTTDKTLLLKGDFFGTDPIKLKFEKSDFENIPELKM